MNVSAFSSILQLHNQNFFLFCATDFRIYDTSLVVIADNMVLLHQISNTKTQEYLSIVKILYYD